jgi:hypothetical protein
VKVYWGFKDVPELANLSGTERRKVLRACFRLAYRQWPFWVGQLAIFVFALLGDLIGLVLQYRFGFSEAVCYACGLAGVLTGCLIYTLVYYTILIDRLRPRFREYLGASRTSD